MFKNLKHFEEALKQRSADGTLRVLAKRTDGIDFYSNDYLGLARNKDLQNMLLNNVSEIPQMLSGSTGSRLISGNTKCVIETEEFLANEHQCESALLFHSGYNANLALISTLPTRHDTLIVDEQVHRSVHDACKISLAKKLKFKHSNPVHLAEILKKQTGNCYVITESLFSMDGDLAPLAEIVQITEKFGAGLIVDEAHAFGIFGYGLVHKLNLQQYVLATIVTYGKALGTHGAAVLTTEIIKSYLTNFASPFIYTTSAHDFLWMSIKTGYQFLKVNSNLPTMLHENINTFRKQNLFSPSANNSPIQAIIVPEKHRLRTLKDALMQAGLLTYAIFSPTVREGTERLRICLHSFNSETEIINLAKIIKKTI